jgi:hypothetical protein
MSTELTQPALQRPATRNDLARQLLARVERLPPLLGTVPLATEVQLLKRDLSRGHDVLRASGETSFLSVVTLVESALACLTWKQYDHQVIDALRQAFAGGTQAGPYAFPDYDAVRRFFAERDIATVPAIDLNSLQPEDLGDGEED